MPPRRDRSQQDDATPPPPPPPQLTSYERASVDMLAGITRLLERQTERPDKSHEEDVAERFRKQEPKEFVGTIVLGIRIRPPARQRKNKQ
ncbi:pheophytinase, chloroplastic-like [Dorcoceras hygrometricum]|uniref:Pheophytinase, chloroplastic-like n=1 Tax=Dorcoceras hygrometricum TaxID=472368 RepID=A0A2Z7C0Z7_9LAMI|nr:pheophytinase, chloroplastic-like [Dorcoceras hygrometricum]